VISFFIGIYDVEEQVSFTARLLREKEAPLPSGTDKPLSSEKNGRDKHDTTGIQKKTR